MMSIYKNVCEKQFHFCSWTKLFSDIFTRNSGEIPVIEIIFGF